MKSELKTARKIRLTIPAYKTISSPTPVTVRHRLNWRFLCLSLHSIVVLWSFLYPVFLEGLISINYLVSGKGEKKERKEAG